MIAAPGSQRCKAGRKLAVGKKESKFNGLDDVTPTMPRLSRLTLQIFHHMA
jgi:hypothetical protein